MTSAASAHRWKFHVDYHDLVWAETEEEARRLAVESLREEDGSLLRVRKCIDQHPEEHDG